MVTARRGYEFKWSSGIIRDGAETPVHTDGYNPEIVDKLVVCDMGTELGLGLFAKERIPKGTPVICYTGVES
jgi:SET domain-containing protein